jgi:hypothetical protein
MDGKTKVQGGIRLQPLYCPPAHAAGSCCSPDAAGPGDPEGVPSGFFAVEPSSAVAPPAGGRAGVV